MQRAERSPIHGAVVMLLLLALAACGGPNSSQVDRNAGPGAGVPWPPPDSQRQMSDDMAHFSGAECAAHGGWSTIDGANMVLNGGTGVTWAIYSLAGFSADIQPAKFEVDYSITPGTPGDGTALWVGYADYSKERWSWSKGNPPTTSYSPPIPIKFVSPTGLAALAVVIAGPGHATVTEVRFSRAGDTDLPVPQNLTGLGEIGAVHLDWDDVPGVDGYNVYRSVSNTFDSPVKINALLVEESRYDDLTVGADITYYYKVTAVKYSESAMSDICEVYAPLENLDIPQNLRATPLVQQIQLDWDAVDNATGYEVFRDESWRWNNPVKITATPTPGTTYTDTTATPAKIYYYRVRAAHVGYSGLSNMVDIFVPQIDLQAPENPRATAITQLDFRTSWDWSITNPTGFTAYVSTIPNFSLMEEDASEWKTQMGWGRSLLWDGRTEQTTYYFRLVARSGANYGRMTDDIAVTTLGYWHWDDVEDIGVGGIPLVMVKDSGDLTAAYFNGKQIDVARRSAGVWTVEPGVLSETDDAGGFGAYLDMASSGGQYIICSYALMPGDLWAATGGPGAWSTERVDGDGSTGMGHTVSGDYCKAIASPDEFGLLYMDQPAVALMLKTRPTSGGSWTSTQMRGGVVAPLYHSGVYLGANLFVLMMDPATHQLQLGDRDGGWVFADIGNAGGEDLGSYNELLRVGTEWWTPAVNDTTGDFYTLRGSGSTWEMKTVSTEGEVGNPIGANCRLTQWGPDMAMVFYGFSPDPNRWWYGVYLNSTGEWTVEPLQLPGVMPGMYMDIATIGTDPYILYYDAVDSHIKCAKGLAPAS
jgi:hypothetical protein